MTTSPDSPVAEAAEGEFLISRAFDAPLDLVWKANTEAGRLVHWWGPKGFRLDVVELDLRPGGVFRYRVVSPDGHEMWGRFLYREIVTSERIVCLVAFTDAKGQPVRHPMSPTWPLEMLCTTTLVEEAGGTRLTTRSAAYDATEEEHNTFEAGRDGMTAGFIGTWDQLEVYLSGLPSRANREIITERSLDAAPAQVFRAFSDPANLAQWWGPAGFTNTFERFDFRAGGEWRFVMHGPDGTDYPNHSVFDEIVPGERIVFRHLDPVHNFQMNILFDGRGGKTHLTWRMIFDTVEHCDAVRTFVTAANEQNFDRLEAQLAKM